MRSLRLSKEAEGSSTCTTRWDCTPPMARISTWWEAGTSAMGRWSGSRSRSSTRPIRSPAVSSSFFVADEQHTPPYDEGRVHLLLRNRSDDGKTAAAGWVREPGRGRLCHLANGHTLEALLHPMYQKLMCNAVRWCLRSEEPSGRTQDAGRIESLVHEISWFVHL